MSRRYVVVTGTDTGVGKTMATAALAVSARDHGHRVHIHKPVQTGLVADSDPRRGELDAHYTDVVSRGDADIAGGLAGVDSSTGVSLTLPMAPAAAAEAEGVDLPTPGVLADAIVAHGYRLDHGKRIPHTHPTSALDAARGHEDWPSSVVLVEGAGGLLVDVGHGTTLADIAAEVRAADPHGRLEIVIVVRAELGTLNHTALTVEALQVRGLPVSGIVIGSWPAAAGPVAADNRRRLAAFAPVIGVLPAGCGALSPSDFQAQAPGWVRWP